MRNNWICNQTSWKHWSKWFCSETYWSGGIKYQGKNYFKVLLAISFLKLFLITKKQFGPSYNQRCQWVMQKNPYLLFWKSKKAILGYFEKSYF